jgi:hypothetical protein
VWTARTSAAAWARRTFRLDRGQPEASGIQLERQAVTWLSGWHEGAIWKRFWIGWAYGMT